MRVVVTGGNGFAGRWLCEGLMARGTWVSSWGRQAPPNPIPGVHYRVQDIRDGPACLRAMEEDAPDQVFHLAAITSLAEAEADPILAHETNVLGTHHVMAAVPHQAKAVLASTCHVYGPPETLPITEAHPCHPAGTYARTKLQAERVAVAACETVVIARAFHHTGPGQSTAYALSDWATQMTSGGVVRTGDLSLKRDYTDVRDICAGYVLLAADGVPHTAYNLCSGQAPTLKALLEGMADGAPVDFVQEHDRLRAGDIPEFRGDPARAEALGWTRSISREQMLRDLIAGVG